MKWILFVLFLPVSAQAFQASVSANYYVTGDYSKAKEVSFTYYLEEIKYGKQPFKYIDFLTGTSSVSISSYSEDINSQSSLQSFKIKSRGVGTDIYLSDFYLNVILATIDQQLEQLALNMSGDITRFKPGYRVNDSLIYLVQDEINIEYDLMSSKNTIKSTGVGFLHVFTDFSVEFLRTIEKDDNNLGESDPITVSFSAEYFLTNNLTIGLSYKKYDTSDSVSSYDRSVIELSGVYSNVEYSLGYSETISQYETEYSYSMSVRFWF